MALEEQQFLRRGAHNDPEQVRALQLLLANTKDEDGQYFLTLEGEPNGIFDQTVERAVKKLQTTLVHRGLLAKGLVTGVYGPLTSDAVVKYKAIPETTPAAAPEPDVDNSDTDEVVGAAKDLDEGNITGPDPYYIPYTDIEIFGDDRAFKLQQNFVAAHKGNPVNVRISPMLDDSVVSSPRGWRIHPVTGLKKFHHGTDFRASCLDDLRVVAPIGGFIEVDKNPAGGEGVMVTIYGDDGNKYFLMHLKDKSIPAHWKNGDRLEMGELVGTVGHTGLITHTSLHFEVRMPPKGHAPKNKRDFTDADIGPLYGVKKFRIGMALNADITEPLSPGKKPVLAAEKRAAEAAPKLAISDTDALNRAQLAGVQAATPAPVLLAAADVAPLNTATPAQVPKVVAAPTPATTVASLPSGAQTAVNQIKNTMQPPTPAASKPTPAANDAAPPPPAPPTDEALARMGMKPPPKASTAPVPLAQASPTVAAAPTAPQKSAPAPAAPVAVAAKNDKADEKPAGLTGLDLIVWESNHPQSSSAPPPASTTVKPVQQTRDVAPALPTKQPPQAVPDKPGALTVEAPVIAAPVKAPQPAAVATAAAPALASSTREQASVLPTQQAAPAAKPVAVAQNSPTPTTSKEATSVGSPDGLTGLDLIVWESNHPQTVSAPLATPKPAASTGTQASSPTTQPKKAAAK